MRTQVAILGGGPAGLMLSHLLAREGVDSVVIDDRSRHDIEHTIRAGILEADSARLLVESGVSDRVQREGDEHHGIYLRFGGESHHIDFADLVGESVWVYPQTEVFIDLANARERDGGDVRFGVTDAQVSDVTSDSPLLRFTDSDGVAHEVDCDYIVGADGSRSICRFLVPEHLRKHYFREYPFAWLGIIAQAPHSAPELVYCNSRSWLCVDQPTHADGATDVPAMRSRRERGRLVRRSAVVRVQARVARGDGFALKEGAITEKSVLRFRSFVAEPMRFGRLFLAGDAAHTVPPTGAKGLNLALADVRVLAEVLTRALSSNDASGLDDYERRAIDRCGAPSIFPTG